MDYYDTLIQQRDAAEAASLLADDCRNKDQEITAVKAALRGDDEPMLWRITWAESLLEDLWASMDLSEREDPAAMIEAHHHTQEMFRQLRRALLEETTHAT